VAYLAGALLAGVVGYVAGHLSDRVGRRPMILLGWASAIAAPIAGAAVGGRTNLGLLLIVLVPALGSLGNAADLAMVADLVPPERHEAAYASVRVAANFGVTLGPPIGGLLLLGQNWDRFFLGVTPLAIVAFAIAWRYIPRGGKYAPTGPPERGSLGVIL